MQGTPEASEPSERVCYSGRRAGHGVHVMAEKGLVNVHGVIEVPALPAALPVSGPRVREKDLVAQCAWVCRQELPSIGQ